MLMNLSKVTKKVRDRAESNSGSKVLNVRAEGQSFFSLFSDNWVLSPLSSAIMEAMQGSSIIPNFCFLHQHMISLWIAWTSDYCMEQYVLLHDVSVISTPVQGTLLMISNCQLTLLFLTLAFKACLENLRQTLSDMCEREGITTFTVSPTSISPSFLSLLQCSGHGGAMLSSPWVPFYYFCTPPDFAMLSKASVCSLSPEFLALGACCSIKAKSWKYVGFTPPWRYS